MSNIVPVVEVEVYAPGLRDADRMVQLSHQMDLQPKLRYKIDTLHEIVYFETDVPGMLTQKQIVQIFRSIGLEARFVGDVSDKLPMGDSSETQPLMT